MTRASSAGRLVTARRAPPAVLGAVVVAPIALAVVAATRWVWVLVANAGRGLDVSDEASYLLAASRPADAEATVSDFGFYLRPLLWLSGGSLRWFRVAGMVVVLVACAGAAVAATDGSASERRTSNAHRVGAVLCATALVSATALTYYGLWLPTPSYNLLNLVLMMLVGGSLIAGSRALVRFRERSSAFAGFQWRELWPLAALGGLLAVGTTIKASSYLAATLVCAVCLAVVAGPRFLAAARVALIGALAGLAVHWGLIAGAPMSDLRRLRRGVEALDLLNSHSPSRAWENDFLVETAAPWFAALSFGIVLTCAAWHVVRSPTARSSVVVSLAALAFVLMWNGRPRGGPASLSDATGWWWVRMGALTLALISALAPRPSRLLIVGPCVALLGVAASVGSNNGVVRQIGMTAGLIGLGVLAQAVAIVRMMDRPLLRSVAAVPAALFFTLASVTSMGVLNDAQADPYRLGSPLAESNHGIDLGRFGSVMVTPSVAAYINGLQALSEQLSDEQRRCLINLTGGTPIAAIALDARPAGSPWLIGGYSGSADAADFWLSHDDCVSGPIALLEAPGGFRSVPRPSWLSERSFRVVGQLLFNGYLDQIQVLSVADDVDGK